VDLINSLYLLLLRLKLFFSCRNFSLRFSCYALRKCFYKFALLPLYIIFDIQIRRKEILNLLFKQCQAEAQEAVAQEEPKEKRQLCI
jgi:hypothetical protein